MYEVYEVYEDTHIAVVGVSAASLYVSSDTHTTAICVLILLKLMHAVVL